MTESVYETLIQVRYSETDQMKFVYYSRHFEYFEVARTECLAAWGFPYQELEEKGYAIPVLEAHCEYLAPARYGDALVVLTRASSIDRLRLRFDFETRRGGKDGTLIATGWTTHVCMDPSGKPRRPFKELAAKFDPS